VAAKSGLPSELLDMIGREACAHYWTLAQLLGERAVPLAPGPCRPFARCAPW
jgi:hypothetical protein